MKKNSFIDGAIVATISIVFCKILGLLYVIPFYKIIGTQGGALYSYAYSIYAVFLNLSTIGIPAAVSKIVSEYDALNFQSLRDRSFKIASNLLNYAGLFSFVIMFVFSDLIAESIIGGVEGGNSVSSVSIAIKVVSLALIVVPKLSILRGYFEGNKYIAPASYSTVLEQLVRVAVIIIGSYVVVNVLHMPVNYAVYIAVFGATAGSLSSYIYLKIKAKPLLKEDAKKIKITKEEKNISTKFLLKKIVFYAIPFVIISLLQSAYQVVDTFTVVRTLSSLGYATSVAETAIGVMSTWGSKLNVIVISMSFGLTSSLVPNVVGSYAKEDFKDINNKINLSAKMLVYIMAPMTIGISVLAFPIWHVFYGVDTLSSNIFSIYILQVIFYGLYTTLIMITQSMSQTKIAIGSLIISFLLKLFLNIPMMYIFKYFGIPAYFAPTLTNVISQLSVLIGTLIALKKKFNFDYSELKPFILKVVIALITMFVGLSILKMIYFNNSSIFFAIITIIIYSVIGAIIYFAVSNRFKLMEEMLGKNYISKILKKLKISKKIKS